MLTLQVGKLISISFILNTQDNLIVYHKLKKKKRLSLYAKYKWVPLLGLYIVSLKE